MKVEGLNANIARIQRIQEALQGDHSFADEIHLLLNNKAPDYPAEDPPAPLMMHHQIRNMADVLSGEELAMLQQMFPGTSSNRGAAAYRSHAGNSGLFTPNS